MLQSRHFLRDCMANPESPVVIKCRLYSLVGQTTFDTTPQQSDLCTILIFQSRGVVQNSGLVPGVQCYQHFALKRTFEGGLQAWPVPERLCYFLPCFSWYFASKHSNVSTSFISRMDNKRFFVLGVVYIPRLLRFSSIFRPFFRGQKTQRYKQIISRDTYLPGSVILRCIFSVWWVWWEILQRNPRPKRFCEVYWYFSWRSDY